MSAAWEAAEQLRRTLGSSEELAVGAAWSPLAHIAPSSRQAARWKLATVSPVKHMAALLEGPPVRAGAAFILRGGHRVPKSDVKLALLPSNPATVGLGVLWGSAARSYLRHYLEVPWSHMNAWRLWERGPVLLLFP